jgi:hypothetical protein
MTSKRLHTVLMAGLALLFLGLIGGTYATNKLLASQADKLTALKAKSMALDQEQLSLTRAKKDIKKYDKLDKIAQAVVPQDKNQAEAVREIVNIAAANDVSLASISFPASTLGNLPGGTAAPSSSGSTVVSPTPSAGAGNSKAGSLSQLTPLRNIPGVYQLPITIKGDTNNPVQYEKFINFLSDLEHNRRTAQVETITLQPTIGNRDYVTFELTLSEYIKP